MKLKFRRALQAAEALHRKRHQYDDQLNCCRKIAYNATRRALRRQMSAMHPELVAGSYKRYKTDTNTFTTWLAKSAAACGYKIPKDVPQEPSSTAPPKPTEPTHREKIMTLPEKLRAQADKKREKREGKKTPRTVPATSIPIVPSTVTHTVRTQDLLRQAEVVSKNAKIQVPDAILQVVKRAINARKRCAEWFAQTGIDNGHSTERHMHFAKVLENAMEILKPGFGKADGVYAAVQHTAPNTQLKPKPGTTALHDLSGLNNRFSNLEVEGTEDFVEPSTALQLLPVSGTPVKPSQKAPTPKAVDVYELEQDNAWEKMFDVYCFFEDLHRIQEFLNDTWKKYKHGEIDLLSATIITNSAFDIIRREEEQVTAFAFGHQKLSYIDLCTMIFFAEAFGKNKSMNSLLESSGTLRITPFDNFIYLSTARSLMKFEKFTSMKIQVPPMPP